MRAALLVALLLLTPSVLIAAPADADGEAAALVVGVKTLALPGVPGRFEVV